MDNIINIYCDESSVENNESKFFVIGAVFVSRNKKNSVLGKFKKIAKEYSHSTELKWNKVGSKYLDFYKKIVDLFVTSDDLIFRSIIVEKNKVDFDGYHNNDRELAFYKFYYLLLKEKLANQNNYYIFLDRKPTRDRNRARSLHSFLESYVLFNRVNTNIRHFQAYDSKENKLIQLADFFTGLIAYSNNSSDQSSVKQELVSYFESKLALDTSKSTSYGSQKVNIFKWSPKI